MRACVRDFCVLAALLSTSPAQAYRPFDSTDADVVDRGEVEVELEPVGYLDDGSEQLVAPDLVMNIGLDPRVETWELGVGLILEGPERFRVRPVVEGTFFREVNEKSEATGLVGLIWEARDNLAFDLAFRYARDDGTDVREVRAGLSWSVQGLFGGGL